MFRRAPWWMYLLATAFLGSAAEVVSLEFRGPEDPGIRFVPFTSGLAVADFVTPGSPAARAGIEKGDRLVALDGQPVRSGIDWAYALGEVNAGRPLHFQIERSGLQRDLIVILGRRSA